MVDGGEPEVDSRDEGKHTGRNDLAYGLDAKETFLPFLFLSPFYGFNV